MYKSHIYSQDRRDNERRGSSYENDYHNRNRNSYRDEQERYARSYEDERRYDRGNYASQKDDYGPFSNIYSDEQSDRRRDFDTRYNDRDNYYYDRSHSTRQGMDEAYGKSFGDIFGGGRKRNDRDRDYFTSYRSGDENRYGSDSNYSLYGSHESEYDRRNRYADERDPFRRSDDSRNQWRDHDRNPEYRYRNESDNRNSRDVSYHGYSTGYDKRRRY